MTQPVTNSTTRSSIPVLRASESAPLMAPRLQYDVIVIGAGVAGLAFTLSLPPELRVALLTKGVLGESNTRYAQGGLSAAVGADDNPGSARRGHADGGRGSERSGCGHSARGRRAGGRTLADGPGRALRHGTGRADAPRPRGGPFTTPRPPRRRRCHWGRNRTGARGTGAGGSQRRSLPRRVCRRSRGSRWSLRGHRGRTGAGTVR